MHRGAFGLLVGAAGDAGTGLEFLAAAHASDLQLEFPQLGLHALGDFGVIGLGVVAVEEAAALAVAPGVVRHGVSLVPW